MGYKKESIDEFLKNQLQLFDEPVASTPEEAQEFLEDCMAVECGSYQEVVAYFKECGTDVSGMTKQDMEEASEVFVLSEGNYLIVEG